MIRFIHLFLAFLALFAGNAQAVEIGRQIKIDTERPKPIVAPSAIAHLGARQPSGAAFAVPPLSTENRTGQRSGVDHANGVATRYSYDLMGRLTNLSHNKASEVLASYIYSLRPDGRRSAVTEKRLEAGGVLSQTSISYTYDELNRLTQEASTSDDPGAVFQTSYSYDICGNRLKKATAGAESISYAYNEADQLLSENSTTKGQTTYGYDAGGNLISKNASAESASYSYDLEGRMVTAEIARIEQGRSVTATSNFSYNLSGTRVGAVTTGNIQGQGAFSESRKFLVDEANFTGYSQVLEEFDGSGALARSYVIGDDILSQNRGNGSETLLADRHGSTRLLVNTAGEVMDRYSFDAYGVLLGGHKGLCNRAGTNYLYSGEEFDDLLQMQYLRARYYDQNTGFFNGLDKFFGDVRTPQSFNKYSYCHNDPINGIDPSGMTNTIETSTVSAIMTKLFSVSFAVLNLIDATSTAISIINMIAAAVEMANNPGVLLNLPNLDFSSGDYFGLNVDDAIQALDDNRTKIRKAVSRHKLQAFRNFALKRDRHLLFYLPTPGRNAGNSEIYFTPAKISLGKKFGDLSVSLMTGGYPTRFFGMGLSYGTTKAEILRQANQLFRMDWDIRSANHANPPPGWPNPDHEYWTHPTPTVQRVYEFHIMKVGTT